MERISLRHIVRDIETGRRRRLWGFKIKSPRDLVDNVLDIMKRGKISLKVWRVEDLLYRYRGGNLWL